MRFLVLPHSESTYVLLATVVRSEFRFDDLRNERVGCLERSDKYGLLALHANRTTNTAMVTTRDRSK